MKYTDELLKKVEQLGMLGYGLDKVMNIVDPADRVSFAEDFDNPESELTFSYRKGKDLADFAIDSKLFNLAKEGDMEALSLFNERRIQRKIEEEDRLTDLLS